MPQLNPAPWLMIMLASWLILLTILLPKMMMHKPMNDMTINNLNKTHSSPWTWPWH
uniref:ATP synthase complex subunit 8 n=1 Tax=Boulengerula taitana TaxID=102246 RepID=C8UZR1_BOUTA|nr:ATP synthase F0 subunit 8 [Boulengerula taitana]AAX58639.1 ATP synthase F0 subunit 8 [Boulengerula taitana]ACS37018.1 ATP synthase F0 subunit 8 [Boulengerula taitana]